MPDRNAPAATDMLNGRTLPRSSMPHSWPSAIRGRNTNAVTANIGNCARNPAERPVRMTRRQAEVKPNAAW